jgi:ABC-2 type transport system permease protein
LVLARRTLSDARVRTLSFGALFAFVAYANAAAYRSDYSTPSERLGFAHAFAANASVRLFYGVPRDLLSVGGYTAWRTGGLLSLFAGVWGMLAATRALRAEEDAGRTEVIIAAPVSRRRAFLAAIAGCLAGAVILWAALLAGLLAGRLAAAESSYLALATLTPALVFLGVGAVACQLAGSRRIALELSAGVLLLAFLARVIADTSSSLEWLRWATPFGWSEELRAFTGARPAVLALPAAASLGMLALALVLWSGRDVAAGLLRGRERLAARHWGLSSATALALRDERASFAGWLLGTGFFAIIIGLISTSVSSIGISSALRRQARQLGGVSITTPAGYVGLSFLFFLLAISLFACSQLAAARHEEAEGRAQTVLALPLARERWLGGRLALALAGVVVLSLATGVLAWAGTAIESAGISLGSMLEAGVNCVPIACVFLALSSIAFALAPRASVGISYGILALAFVWQLLSGLLGAPSWLRALSPFDHVGLAPAQPLKTGAMLAMLGLAALGAAASVWAFARRDLVEA